MYNEKLIRAAEDLEAAAEILESGEAAVKVLVNGQVYVVIKEENYHPELNGTVLK